MIKDPEAVILNQKPVPLRKWKTPTEIRENHFKPEYWEYDYTFFEYKGDDEENIYFLQTEFRRREPGYIYGVDEYFVTKRRS